MDPGESHRGVPIVTISWGVVGVHGIIQSSWAERIALSMETPGLVPIESGSSTLWPKQGFARLALTSETASWKSPVER